MPSSCLIAVLGKLSAVDASTYGASHAKSLERGSDRLGIPPLVYAYYYLVKLKLQDSVTLLNHAKNLWFSMKLKLVN